MIILQFLLIYCFIGLIWGVLFMWAITHIEQYDNHIYHNRLKWAICLLYIVLWPLMTYTSIRAYFRLNTTEKILDNLNETCDVFRSLNTIFDEEDP